MTANRKAIEEASLILKHFSLISEEGYYDLMTKAGHIYPVAKRVLKGYAKMSRVEVKAGMLTWLGDR